MKMNNTPDGLFRDYEKAVAYNTAIGLYDTVEQNENFFIGRQWEGVNAPDLEKPVLNFLRRVVTYFVSMIVSDDIAVSFTPMRRNPKGEEISKILSAEVERVLELAKVQAKNRELLRDCAVDGDAGFYLYFDQNIPTGQFAQGEVAIESIDNTKALFGNPYLADAQKQPWILLVRREQLEETRRRAAALGLDPEGIKPDGGQRYYGEEADTGQDLVTVLTRLWKEGDTVWFTECVQDIVLRPPVDTGYHLYPVAWMNWERVKNSYHGQAAITGLIPNQVFVNKMWAMAMEQVKRGAFPKVVYDKTRVKNWTNRVGEAIGVTGDVREAIASTIHPTEMSMQVLELVDKTISYTKEFMGASDAALGNVKPDNTSAIIAVQKASSAPLELQRLAFYQFMEDTVRILVDMMCADYGVRMVNIPDEEGNLQEIPFDFSTVRWEELTFHIDVGASSYWSELTQIQTLDNLFSKGIITDAVTYLEGIPDQYVKGKNKIIQKLKEQQMGGEENGFVPDLPNSLDGRPLPQPGLPGV